MKLSIIQIGKTQEAWLKQALEEYYKRLRPYLKFEVIELADQSLRTAGSIESVKAKEAASVLKRLKDEDYVVLLDERGVEQNSVEFARFWVNMSEVKHVVFVIGGVYGTDVALKKRADLLFSLSKLTFTHQFARLILIEQIYRAMMIGANRQYHY
ncbi:MAG: 23S rRNA (pseudouridine(1915)-N(3))-methyltransferase RlmH [Candidatus Cloacimonetes bacterium]|nr:23S rRNA (pseudouridine(1915)-N(3))-methyltransferase RlmH [Candidatus Cloacimonadota bacterium]